MTNIVQVKRITLTLALFSILVSCNIWNSWFGREEINVGQYVNLQAQEVPTGSTLQWVFAQLPDSSKLTGFLPADTVEQVAFKPDTPGEYDVVLQVTTAGKINETNYYYNAVIPADSSLVDQELPEYLSDTSYANDTTVSDSPVVGLVADEEQRDYLAKVIAPGQSKTRSYRTSRLRQSTPRKSKPAPISRGNLIPRAAKTYTIQVSSWPSQEEAQAASRELLDKYGIDSYVQRAFFKDKDEIYYRLRVGSFPNQAAAEAYAKEIQSMTSLPVWVDYVRQEM